MASATGCRAVRLVLKRHSSFHHLRHLQQLAPSRCGINNIISLRNQHHYQRQQQQHQIRPFHHTSLCANEWRGGNGGDGDGVRPDGSSQHSNKANEVKGSKSLVEGKDEKRYPTKLSMTDEDEPDFLDLADLIMSGSSYDDVVRGTKFDDLDQASMEEWAEAQKRMNLLREDALEEYLIEKGEKDFVDEVNAPERRRLRKAKRMELNKKTVEPDFVEMAQGDWAEVLVHSDRVQKTVKGGMEVSYRALVVVGNLNGVGGFAMGKAKNPADAVIEASRKAKLPKNVIYVERYKGACLFMDVLGKHNGCKAYLWARPPGYGMRASPLVRMILYNMGITDAGCKIVGNRNRYSMIYAMFKALAKHRGLEATAQTRGKRILSLHRGHAAYAH